MAIQTSQISFREILEMIFQNKWLFMFCTLLGLLGAYVVYNTKDKWYESRAEIQVLEQSREPLIQGLGVTISVNRRFNEVRAQIMSVPFLTTVVRGLKEHPEYSKHIPNLAAQDEKKAAQNLKAYVSMGLRQGVISVYCERRDQNEAWAIVDYMKDIVQSELESFSDRRMSSVNDTLKTLLDEYEGSLREKEEVLRNFEAYNQLELAESPEELTDQARELGVKTANSNRLVSQYMELSDMHTKNGMELAKMRAELEAVRAQIEAEPEFRVMNYTTEQSKVFMERQAQLSQAMAELESLRQHNTEKHPFVQDKLSEVKRFQRMLDEVKQPIVTQEQRVANPVLEQLNLKASNLESDIAATQRAQEDLFARLNDLTERVSQIPSRELMKTRLRREQGIVSNIYSQLRVRYEKASLTSRLDLEEKKLGQKFTVIGEASRTGSPIRPNMNFVLAMGTFLGMVVGVVFCFVREFTDTSFRNIDDASRFLDMPVLGVIPEVTGGASARGRSRALRTGRVDAQTG
jgi:uncharacterized protein involved in exopolysaccharide biosynthesis